MGSTRIVISVTNIVGVRAGPPNGSGIVPAPAPSFVVNCQAPAGLLVNSHSYPYSISKNVLSHVVGVAVHTTSRLLVMASLPTPVPNELFQPRPCSSSGQPWVSGRPSGAQLAACPSRRRSSPSGRASREYPSRQLLDRVVLQDPPGSRRS